MSAQWCAAFAPASTSNLGPGFDCFGFPLEGLGDTVLARESERPGVRLLEIRGRAGALPLDPTKNTAAVAAAAIWNRDPARAAARGLELILDKQMPFCSGLGSSAASAVAGAKAAALLIERGGADRCSDADLLAAALDGEAAATGSRHADNVAPALLGGFVIVTPGDPPQIARFEPRLQLMFAVVTPALSVPTRDARAVLPAKIALKDACVGWANSANLVLALLNDDAALFARALVDRIVEPRRAALITGYNDVKRAALEHGALGCVISGSGPSMLAATRTRRDAERVAQRMIEAFAGHRLEATALISPIGHHGARAT
jgi:homoserine kinase